MDSYYGDGGALIQDPSNALVYYSGGTVLSGSYSVMSVSKSTDGGATWPQRCFLNAVAGYCYALAVDPGNPSIVYAGGNPGLYKSTDAGSSWSLSSTGITGYVYDIKINPSNTNLLYAGSADGVFRSTNAGGSWSDVGCDSVNALLINPSHPDTVYAGTGYGVFISTNAGSSWSAMNGGLANLKIKALAQNPGNYLFCGTAGAAYRWSLGVGAEESPYNARPALALKISPNPCPGTTMLSVGIRAEGLGLKIYDAAGRLVNSFVLTSATNLGGLYAMRWNGTDQSGRPVPNGVYFVEAKSDSQVETKTLLLVR
jgi:hypothetical protein